MGAVKWRRRTKSSQVPQGVGREGVQVLTMVEVTVWTAGWAAGVRTRRECATRRLRTGAGALMKGHVRVALAPC